jgi:outer membrane protein assembly factor BamB
MFRHDLSHTGRTPYTGPAAPDVKWAFTADDGIASSPAIAADGTIYVGAGWYFDGTTDTCLYAINPDGSLKWRYRARGGIFSSPAIGPNGMVYFSSLDNRIYALEDAGTYWDIKWQYSLGTMAYSSPAVGSDGTIYVGSLNFRMYALAPNGILKWSFPTDFCVFSSPAIGPGGELYFGSKDHHLYSLDDMGNYGSLRWRYATGVFYDGHFVDSSPAIGADGTLYVGTDPYGGGGKDPVPVDTVFFAVNPDGSLKWAVEMGDGAESSPAIGPDGTVYVGSFDGNLYAIRDDGDVGVIEWTFPTGGAIDGSPSVDGCGVVYFGSRDSTLYALNPDGTLRWSFKTGGEIEGSPSIDKDGTLYVGSFDGNLYAIGNSGPDVGVVSVDLPGEVRNDSTYLPLATVRNYRSGSSSFGVACSVDSAGERVYADTVYVTQLAETTSSQVTFAPWKVGINLGVEYTIAVSTLLEEDGNLYNDTLAIVAETVPGTIGVCEEAPEALTFASRCHPNPFSAAAEIEFSLSERSPVTLKIYDVTGRLVRVLVDEELSAGVHSGVRWDGRDDAGIPVAAGVYLYQLASPARVDTKKIVLLK